MSTTQQGETRVPAIAGLPTVEEIDAIAAMEPGPLRNLRITHTYHRLAVAMSAVAAGGANWCAFAVWASRQAGETIRGEDLARLVETRLATPAAVTGFAARAWRRLARTMLVRPNTRRGRVLRVLCDPVEVLRRSSAAISAGNLKVFAEIGRQFARFAAECAPGPVPDAVLERFVEGIRPGPLPDGQELLRQAFRHYARAMAAADEAEAAEWLLLANVEIGLHEQTRLQPEIQGALDAPVDTYRGLGDRLLEALFPGAPGWPSAARAPLAAMLGGAGKVAEGSFRRFVRNLVTEEMMEMALPAGTVRLGRAMPNDFPAPLRAPKNPELVALLERFRPRPDDADGVGASDWARLDERMQLIAHVFRLYHADRLLFTPPFPSDQLRRIEAGVVPDGAL